MILVQLMTFLGRLYYDLKSVKSSDIGKNWLKTPEIDIIGLING